MLKKNIFITGFMGTGKSTVAKALASQTGKKYIDMDYLIENKKGKSINSIFNTEGELYFRKLEKELLKEIIGQRDLIIATGGGTLLDKENYSLAQKNGIIILLSARPEVIFARLQEEKIRPLLLGENKYERILYLMHKREGQYNHFKNRIDTSDLTIEQVINQILETIIVEENNMEKTTMQFEKKYSSVVIIGYDILSDVKKSIIPFLEDKEVIFITNPLLKQLYGNRLVHVLSSKGINVNMIEVPDGEQSKSMNMAKKIYDQLLEYKISRSTTLITLGGGVIGDLGGFVSATFMRGIPLIHIPTTLLGQIDSSIGGKVAIDHPKAKNMIGNFYQPVAVLVDTRVLETLPVTHLKNGLVEAIKISIICSSSFFNWLSHHIDCILKGDKRSLEVLVNQAIKLKMGIVLKDPWERKERLCLNYGHSIGHALEAIAGYKGITHGEAVAAGIILETQIAYYRNLCKKEEKVKIESIIKKLDIPIRLDYRKINLEKCWDTILLDKKNKNGAIRFVLPLRIGKVKLVQPISKEDITYAFNSFIERKNEV